MGKANKTFFLFLLAVYTLCMQVAILVSDKGDEVLFFCYYRADFWTSFFKVVTILGEWLGLLSLGLFLLLRHRKAFVAGILGYIPMHFLLTILKRSLDYPRPLHYFTNGEISAIENMKPLLHHSMPSGHTFTAFFCMSFFIIHFHVPKTWQFILFLSAFLVGISRIYLMCHFKEDVFIGSILGIIAGILSQWIYEKTIKNASFLNTLK